MSLWEQLIKKHDYTPVARKKWVVYTANFGRYDDPSRLADSINKIWKRYYSKDEIDFVMFVDKRIVWKGDNENWKLIEKPLIQSKFRDKDKYLTSRKYKLSIDEIFYNYENSLYIDSNCILSEKIFELMKKFENSKYSNGKHVGNLSNVKLDMMALHHQKHPNFDSEATHAHQHLRTEEEKKIMDRQKDFYNSHSYNGNIKQMPFITGRILIRRHSNNIKELGNLWFEQAEEWTHRDQVSWQYVYYKKGLGKISLDVITDQNVLCSRDLAPQKHLTK